MTADPSAPALVSFVFAATRRLNDQPDGRTWLSGLWDACAGMGMSQPIVRVAPMAFPERLSTHGGFRILASRQSAAPGIRQALLFASHDVTGVMTVIAPNPAESWPELESSWTRAAAQEGCDITTPPEAILQTVTLYLGLTGEPPARRRRTGNPVAAPGTLASPCGERNWPGQWTRVPPGFLLAQASPASPSEDRCRRMIVLAPAFREADLDRWAWSSARQLPPLARYLLHAAKIHDQLRVYQRGQGFREVRQRVERCIDELTLLNMDTVDLRLMHRARTELARQQADSDGLVTTLTRIHAMSRTAEIAMVNMATAVTLPDPPRDHGEVFAPDQQAGVWLRAQLSDDAAYLEATLQRADRISQSVDTSLQERRHRYQEQLTLLQTSVIGAMIMALTVVLALQYKLSIPGPAQAPAIATAAAIALALPGAVLRWIRGIGHDAPLRSSDLTALALSGAAIGWLISALATHTGRAHLAATIGAPFAGAALLFLSGHLALRRLGRSAQKPDRPGQQDDPAAAARPEMPAA